MARPPQITQNNKLSQYLKKEVRDKEVDFFVGELHSFL